MFSSLLSMSGLDTNKRNLYKKESISSSATTLKTINSFRSLPSIKSKSFSASRSNQNNDNRNSGSEELNAVNSTGTTNRRRLSWFERRTWSFRRGNKRNVKSMECWPDITIIFSKDAYEWDEYLTECFTQMIDSQPLTILHERLENINFPLSNYQTQNLQNSRAVLLILSPDLLDFIDAHAEVFELNRLLNPKRTVVMLCGVQQQDISRFHRAALVTYDQWTCLVAKDQDKEFVLSVIQAVLLIIQQNQSHSSNKPQFKLSPRKVREGNGKVFVLLDSPIDDKQQIDILFDGSNENQVSVKCKNAYNLYFTIPDTMLRVARVMNISLVLDNKQFIGTRPLKCDTKMSELHSLLTSVNTPFEFMSQTLGFATLSEVDTELANRFSNKLPNFGSMFANDMDIIGDQNRTSECYLPTLLHFASAYGLRELTTKLLHCPLALKACQMRNSNNLTPAQIAHHLNHSDIGSLLDDFQRLSETQKLNVLYDIQPIAESGPTVQEKTDMKTKSSFKYSSSGLSSAHHQLYGLRLYSDLLHIKQNNEFLSKNNNKSSDESIDTNISEYDKQEVKNGFDLKDITKCESISDSSETESTIGSKAETFSQLNDKNLVKKINNFEASLLINDRKSSENVSEIKYSMDLNDIQKELLNIIELFKNGMSFEEFEPLFDKWQTIYCNVLEGNVSKELNNSLTQIKTLCEIGRKQQNLENNKHSLKFNDLRYYLNSKLNNKLNDNNLKQTLHERLQLLSLNELFSSDTFSSITTSSASSGVSYDSSIDGSNHSTKPSDNENNRQNRRNYKNNYYKRLKAKAVSLVDKQSESQTKDKPMANKIRGSKPPAPPPRIVSISETNKANELNEWTDPKTNSNHSLYYNCCQNDSKPENKELGFEDNLTQFSDKPIENTLKPFRNSMSETTDALSHEYVNMSSSRTASPALTKRDPLIDYDLVPSGIPVPINALKLKTYQKSIKHEYDYDIPKVPKSSQNNFKLKIEKYNKERNEKQLNNRNIERQVFV